MNAFLFHGNSRRCLPTIAILAMSVGFAPVAKPAEPDVIEDTLPRSQYEQIPFEEAEAWNVMVTRSCTLPAFTGNSSFSPDYQQLTFMSVNEGKLEIVSLSVQQQAIIKRFPLPHASQDQRMIYYRTGKAMYNWDDPGITYSADGRKLAYGPVSLDNQNNFWGLIIIDLSTEKMITVEIPHEPSFGGPSTMGTPTSWPKADTLYLMRAGGSLSLNLNTLKTQPADGGNSSGNQTGTNHKNLALRLTNDGLTADSRKLPYSRVVVPFSASSWTPDGRHVLFLLKQGARLATLSGSRRSQPVLDFEIGDGLTDHQRATLVSEFQKGGRIWANVYGGGKINPLTEKVIGPDTNDFRGQGYLTQASPVLKFQYSYEIKPMDAKAVLSGFQKEHLWNWNFDAYAELKPVSIGRPTSKGATPAPAPTVPKSSDGAAMPRKQITDAAKKQADGLRQQGTVDRLNGNYDAAIVNLDRAIQINPNDVEAFLSRGIAKRSKGDVTGAIADCERALELDPNNATAYNNRGTVRRSSADVDASIADYKRAIELNPKYGLAYQNRGAAFFGKQNWPDALADLRKAVELTPDNTSAQTLLWLARMRTGEKAAADKELTDFIGRQKERYGFVAIQARFLLGKSSERDLLTAAKTRAQQCSAYYHLAAKRLLAGDQATAKSFFQKCIATNYYSLIQYDLAATEIRAIP